ncbi:MAG: cell division protein FtsZ [Wolbachia endosymbiont of Xenopsylla cheopis]
MSLLRPKITVIGLGGAGGNAVNNMIQSNLQGVEFITANTDSQALDYSLAEKKIQLGINLTKGLGAGASPEVGKGAAEESISEIKEYISDSNMLFITAGMGGGTGTGSAPVIAKFAKEHKILTVGVVTKPFAFEGSRRAKIAEDGLKELQEYVDTLIIIPNQNLFKIANEKTTFSDAFRLADNILHIGVRGITDLMVMPGLINLDFADIKTIMSEMGEAMMGTGEAEGENRAISAAEAAMLNPLLDNISMKGAKGILINITGGADMTLFEVDAAANRVREEVDSNANIIFGATFNNEIENKIRVSVLATGIDSTTPFEDENSFNSKITNNSFYKSTSDEQKALKSYDNLNKQDETKKTPTDAFNGISEVIKNHKRIAELAGENPSWNFNFVDVPAFLRRDNK